MSKNEVSVVTATSQMANLSDFFGNIDFQKLNASITSLANRGELSKTEKKSAMEIINTWNKNVIEKINIEKSKIDEFLAAIQPSQNYYGKPISSLITEQLYIDELEFLIDKVGMRQVYEELQDAIDEYNCALAMQKTKQGIVIDLDTTAEQEVLQKAELDKENIKLNAAVTRSGNKVAKLDAKIIDAINADKDILKGLRALKKKSALMRTAAVECTDMAELAKINVTIDDANVREALKDLVNFKL